MIRRYSPRGEPPCAYGRNPVAITNDSNNLTGALYLDKPAEVAAYDEVWSSVVDACLDEPRSMELMTAIARTYSS